MATWQSQTASGSLVLYVPLDPTIFGNLNLGLAWQIASDGPGAGAAAIAGGTAALVPVQVPPSACQRRHLGQEVGHPHRPCRHQVSATLLHMLTCTRTCLHSLVYATYSVTLKGPSGKRLRFRAAVARWSWLRLLL